MKERAGKCGYKQDLRHPRDWLPSPIPGTGSDQLQSSNPCESVVENARSRSRKQPGGRLSNMLLEIHSSPRQSGYDRHRVKLCEKSLYENKE